jgi:Holliday junction resolvase
MNTTKKGNKLENEYVRYLTDNGYNCIRALRITRKTAKGFKNIRTDFWGMFDIIGLSTNNIVLAQVEASRRHSIKKIVEFAKKVPNSRISYQLVKYSTQNKQWTVYEINVYHVFSTMKLAVSIYTTVYDREFKHKQIKNSKYYETDSLYIKGVDLIIEPSSQKKQT